jgi:hypothetical protein
MPHDENKPVKVKNPEAALQASVARDIKIRLMNDAVRQQNMYLSYAVWENALATKDVAAVQKRAVSVGNEDSKLTNKSVHTMRKQKLEALFYEDELKYEQELAQLGLAYRRIRA